MAGFPVPEEAAGIEIRNSPTTVQTQRLIQSAVDTYEKSKDFYDRAAADADALELRRAGRGRDRRAGRQRPPRQHRHGPRRARDRRPRPAPRSCSTPATTPRPASRGRRSASTRSTAPFDDLDRFAVAGNHDNGPFVARYLDDLGWTMLDGTSVEAPWGGLLLGVDDPRSSGLGNWRDETGPELHRGRRAAGRRGLRRRPDLDPARPRRQPRARGAGPRLRRPRHRRAHPRPGRAGPRRGRGRRDGLHASPTARPAVRRTPSRSAASRAATPTSRS